MNSMNEHKYIARSRKAVALFTVVLLVYIFSLLSFLLASNSSSGGGEHGEFFRPQLPLAVMAGLLGLVGIYSVYLGVGAIGKSQFPSDSASMPLRYKVTYGRRAVIATCCAIIGGSFVVLATSMFIFAMFRA